MGERGGLKNLYILVLWEGGSNWDSYVIFSKSKLYIRNNYFKSYWFVDCLTDLCLRLFKNLLLSPDKWYCKE